MIICEFRRICGSSKDSDRLLDRYHLPQVPDRGELINIAGEPYLIADRGWAIDDAIPCKLYCYLRLSPFQGSQ